MKASQSSCYSRHQSRREVSTRGNREASHGRFDAATIFVAIGSRVMLAESKLPLDLNFRSDQCVKSQQWSSM